MAESRSPNRGTRPAAPPQDGAEGAGREPQAPKSSSLDPARLQGSGIHRTWDGERLPPKVCVLLSTIKEVMAALGTDHPEVVEKHADFLVAMVPLIGEDEARFVWRIATTPRGGAELSPNLWVVAQPEANEDRDRDGWPTGLDEVPTYVRVDWDQAWDEGRDPGFLVPHLLPRGRVVSLNSEAKTGKSLLLLDVAMALATRADHVLGVPNPNEDPVRVLYVDFEMSQADFVSRVHDLGYGKGDHPETLFYTHGSGLALTTSEGADQLLATAKAHQAELVVIDTLIAALDGSENDSEVIRPLHRATSDRLKRAGVTVVWADHTGHKEKGRARGTGDKQAAIDLAWSLKKTERPGEPDLLRLKATHTRTSLSHRELQIERISLPDVGFLEHNYVMPGLLGGGGLAVTVLTPRQSEVRDELDAAGFPWAEAMGRRPARRWMHDHHDPDWGCRNDDLAGVLKWAREHANERPRANPEDRSGTTPSAPMSGTTPGDHSGPLPPEDLQEARHGGAGTTPGDHSGPPDSAPSGTTSPPPYGGTGPGARLGEGHRDRRERGCSVWRQGKGRRVTTDPPTPHLQG